MKAINTVAASLLVLTCAGIASAASAQGLTRAEVRQQLVQAEADGSRFVADASYPDVSPVFQQQVARQKQRDESTGGVASGNSAADAGHADASSAPCVGPASFCTLYFGS